MTLFTLATTVVLYQLARERYFSHHIFSVISLMLQVWCSTILPIAVFVQTAVAFNIIYFLIVRLHIFSTNFSRLS